MAKKSISGLELAALINELQALVRGTVSNIYHLGDKGELLIQIHSNGKQLLKIIPGKLLCLTSVKEAMPERPTGFCMQLRKYLDHAYLKVVEQKDAERIVVFELDKKDKYYLIVELFSKGNIVLTNDKYLIIGALENQNWKDRTVKPGEIYVFPPASINWKNIKEKELFELIHKSEKRNLATSLATDLGLGGVYAEEVCAVAEVDKNKLPKELTTTEGKKLFAALQKFMEQIKKPKGFIYEEQVAPFPLKEQIVHKETETYNEAIDTLNPFELTSPYNKKIQSLHNIIEEQETTIKKHEQSIIENTKKAELIYEKYAPLSKLLEIVKEMKKNKKWDEITLALRKEKKVKSVNLKDKKILIDL